VVASSTRISESGTRLFCRARSREGVKIVSVYSSVKLGASKLAFSSNDRKFGVAHVHVESFSLLDMDGDGVELHIATDGSAAR
jgi:hypothetical protein